MVKNCAQTFSLRKVKNELWTQTLEKYLNTVLNLNLLHICHKHFSQVSTLIFMFNKNLIEIRIADFEKLSIL